MPLPFPPVWGPPPGPPVPSPRWAYPLPDARSSPPRGCSPPHAAPLADPPRPQRGWYVVGGTSSGSPQWAGLVAIADQINGGPLGYLNPALYAIGTNPARYAADFYDVTTGNNGDFAPDIPGFDATTGWDPVTGLGTPNAAVFLPDLVAAVHGA